jgi:flavin-dependent dehydrogenase
MEKHDFIVAGAGPAGLKAGEFLAGAGKDVLILEKRKAEELGQKLCAGAMSPKIYPSMPPEIVDQAVHRVNIYSKSSNCFVFESEKQFSNMISRAKLSKWQLDKAMKAGVLLQDEEHIKGIDFKNKILTTKGGREYNYEKLVGADGSHSLIRKKLGLQTKETFVCFQWTLKNKEGVEDASFWFDISNFGYSGMYLFPHGDYVKMGGGGPYVRGPLKDYIEATKRFFENKGYDLSSGKYGIETINLSYMGHKFGDVTLLGDAAGFPEPILGEGMAYALFSAELEFADGIGAQGKRRDWLEKFLFSNRKMTNFFINHPYSFLQHFDSVRSSVDKILDKTFSGNNILSKIFQMGINQIWLKGRY